MGIADKIIQANEEVDKTPDDQAPEGYYTDDLGYWVELDIRKDHMKFARYILFRIRKLNRHIYYDTIEMKLYNRHNEIEPTPKDIVSLAKIASMITTAQAVWVYDNLKEVSPRLDRNKLVIAPGLAWDIEKSELIDLDGDYYTVGGERDQ